MILVTGVTGFLGGALRRILQDAGEEVAGAARPAPGRNGLVPLPPSQPAFAEALSRRPFALIHAAGPASVLRSLDAPAEDFEGTVRLFGEVLEAVRIHSPRTRVILLSSAAVYGSVAGGLATESAPVRPLSPYAWYKSIAEELGRMYQHVYGVPFLAMRISSAYGRGLRRQVIYDLARKARQSRTVEVLGTGRETRDFIHGEDVARAALALLRRAAFEGEAVNIASGRPTAIQEVTSLIAQHLPLSVTFRFTGHTRPGDPAAMQADVGRLRSLGFEPRWSLAEGVADLAHWLAEEDGSTPAACACLENPGSRREPCRNR